MHIAAESEVKEDFVACNFLRGEITGTSIPQRVQKHRDRLRAAGMRLVQIWVPDSRREAFALECQRQSRLLKNDAHEVQPLD